MMFENIEVGDKVIFKSYGGTYFAATVIEVKSSTFDIRLDEMPQYEYTILKSTGRLKGESKNSWHFATKWNEELLIKQAAQKQREEQEYYIHSFKYWSNIPSDKIEQIYNILKTCDEHHG